MKLYKTLRDKDSVYASVEDRGPLSIVIEKDERLAYKMLAVVTIGKIEFIVKGRLVWLAALLPLRWDVNSQDYLEEEQDG